MPFHLPTLPFERTSLEPLMSAETLDYHHGKHHQAYVDKTNSLLKDTHNGASLLKVLRDARRKGDYQLFNNSAQIWNHSFFWNCLAPAQDQKPSGSLAKVIDEAFGSSANMLAILKQEAVGHFSNGWAWLVLDRGMLKVISLHDADTPIVYEGMKPLLTLDLWEHAYYVDYRNARGAFAENILGRLINWDFVARNLDGDGESRADQPS